MIIWVIILISIRLVIFLFTFTKQSKAKLTNEVQHLGKVLPWDKYISKSPLKSDVNRPNHMPRDTLSAKP